MGEMQFVSFITIFVALCLFGRTYAIDCDAAPDSKDGIGCCNTPRLVNKTIHEECAVEVGGLSTSGFNITRECVMTECIFKKYGVVKDGGVVDVVDIKAGVKNKLEQYEGWENVFNAAVDKCVRQGMDKSDQLKQKYVELNNCNPSYAYIVACIGVNMMVECPKADRGGDATKCDNLRNYFNECPEQFPPKFKD